MQAEKPAGPLNGQIGDEEGFDSGGCGDGVSCEVAGADGAFHGGGPAGEGVVAGEVEAGESAGWGGLGGAEAVDAGDGCEGGAFFDDDVATEELGG